MNESRLRSLLIKFTHAQLFSNVLPFWASQGINISNKIKAKKSKNLIADTFVRSLKGKDLEKLEARLQLLYVYLNSSSKFWNVISINDVPVDGVIIPNELRKNLANLLTQHSYDCMIGSKQYEGGIWTYVRVINSKMHACYILVYPQPGSNLAFYSDVPKQIKPLILQGLVQVFQGSSYNEIPLSNSNIDYLYQSSLQYEHMRQSAPSQPALRTSANSKVEDVGQKGSDPYSLEDEPLASPPGTATSNLQGSAPFFKYCNNEGASDVNSSSTPFKSLKFEGYAPFHKPEVEGEDNSSLICHPFCLVKFVGTDLRRGIMEILENQIDPNPFTEHFNPPVLNAVK